MSALNCPLRWGFFGAGKVTSDFATVVGTFPRTEHIPYGIASRDPNRAKSFAESHGISKFYDSYRKLVEDSDIDVVYIGTVNSEHFHQAKMAMEHGKHVLIEKAICVTYKECKGLTEIARENGVFLMEGFWTVTFPAAQKLLSEIRNGAIGDIVTITLEIGRGGNFSKLDRFRLKELGGGVLLNHGIYGLMLTYLMLGYPDLISAVGHVTEGIDETVTVTLSYKDKACLSNLIMSSRGLLESVLRVVGTDGNAYLPFPFWAPDKCILPSGTYTYPHPSLEGIKHENFNYFYSHGFVYEIEEVRRCIQQGLKESPLMPWDASLSVMKMADEIRKQVGAVFPQDEL